jgi:hypothetical protein
MKNLSFEKTKPLTGVGELEELMNHVGAHHGSLNTLAAIVTNDSLRPISMTVNVQVIKICAGSLFYFNYAIKSKSTIIFGLAGYPISDF